MCLEVFDVMFGDTRDSNGAERFLQLNLHHLYRPFDYQATLRAFFPSKSVSFIYLTPTIIRQFSFRREIFKKGPNCCSNETISFHPVKDGQILEYDYLVKYNRHSKKKSNTRKAIRHSN